MRRLPGWILLAIIAALPAVAAADSPPPPLTSDVYSFPGAVRSPSSAASAGMALADLYLGDEPFENPAVPPRRIVSLSPMFEHISRQDLRGRFRSLDEGEGYFDAAGGWVGFGWGATSLFIYADQPALRLEDTAYLTGPLSGSPASIVNNSTMRETRVGGGLSWGGASWRVGVAGEYTKRDDSYHTEDHSGSPLSGESQVDFSGSAMGGQVGARFETGPSGVGHMTVGLAYRLVPELQMDGSAVSNLTVGGSTSGPVSVTRESGSEYGVGVRWVATEQLRVMGSLGGRSEQEWKGFGVARGAGAHWGVGLDFHDARDPWTLRFGLGQDSESGVPEPRNGVIGVGFGWTIDRTQLDLAASRHTFKHLDSATNYDDRIVLTVGVPF